MCFSCCGILVKTENGQPVEIKRDPDNPVNHGSICLKAKAALDL
jgi:anaerobic selenocysteine-containing dehydrogenase